MAPIFPPSTTDMNASTSHTRLRKSQISKNDGELHLGTYDADAESKNAGWKRLSFSTKRIMLQGWGLLRSGPRFRSIAKFFGAFYLVFCVLVFRPLDSINALGQTSPTLRALLPSMCTFRWPLNFKQLKNYRQMMHPLALCALRIFSPSWHHTWAVSPLEQSSLSRATMDLFPHTPNRLLPVVCGSLTLISTSCTTGRGLPHVSLCSATMFVLPSRRLKLHSDIHKLPPWIPISCSTNRTSPPIH